ncbi:MAG: hypothetical protein SGARI_003608 [Bacillariaceae sp.]
MDASNPYLALRAEKIARNEARLKELGLWKKQQPKRQRQEIKNERKTSKKRSLDRTSMSPSDSNACVRRSSRLSEKVETDQPSYLHVEITPHDEKITHKKTAPAKKRAPTKPTTIAANSVRSLSLSAPIIVKKFLGKHMESTGKETVINQAFEEAAASTDELQSMEGTRLSFNKYCGVQEWFNGAFLWVNMGGPTTSNSVVNEFLEEGRLVTWFGGSRMNEETPVIQKLSKLGKQAVASSASPPDSGIMLWCRLHNAETKKFGPYTMML